MSDPSLFAFRARARGRAARPPLRSLDGRVAQHVQPLVQLLVGDHEWKEMAEHVVVDAAGNRYDAVLHGAIDERAEDILIRLLGVAILDELDADHRPDPANVSDLGDVLGHLLPSRPEGLSDLLCPFDEPLLFD